ncbi:hypothetical protein DL96DRAFT_1604192, partial [Flagelloscypha sp. PMI_526]
MSSSHDSAEDHLLYSTGNRSSAALSITRSAGSDRFQESVYLIPDRPSYPKSTFKSYISRNKKDGIKPPKRFAPFITNIFIVFGTTLSLLFLGVGLEVGIYFSNRDNGFPVPKENKLGFIGGQSFLLSVAPLILIIPNAILYRELDWMVRYYQPYIVLQRGQASADETLLLDYVATGTWWSIFYSMKHKHRIVTISSITAIATFALQPLGSSIFSIGAAMNTKPSSVTSMKTLGVSPDVNDLSSFVAAAGFTDAAVVHGLDDPPFVRNGWATAEFSFLEPALNGTMAVNTTGIITNPNCQGATAKPTLTDLGNGTLTLTATSTSGCPATATLTPGDAVSQYGIAAAPCGDSVGKSRNFQPVMFWYFSPRSDTNANQADAIFCAPTVQPFNVHAVAVLDSGKMQSCEKISGYTSAHNITDPFNSVIFDETNFNAFVKARSVTTRTSVSGAVFKAAQLAQGGPQSIFDLPNGFLDLTTRIYTKHLAVSAKSIYFVNQNSTIESDENSFSPRLFINPIPGHFLAILLFSIGFVGIFVHLTFRRYRNQLHLYAPPGTIAHTVALTAHSGFGQLLVPYDTPEQMLERLKGLKFTLDKRTGAIVADEDLADIDEAYALPSAKSAGTDWPRSPAARIHLHSLIILEALAPTGKDHNGRGLARRVVRSQLRFLCKSRGILWGLLDPVVQGWIVFRRVVHIIAGNQHIGLHG